jgi:hypothetical protein
VKSSNHIQRMIADAMTTPEATRLLVEMVRSDLPHNDRWRALLMLAEIARITNPNMPDLRALDLEAQRELLARYARGGV